MCEFVYRVLGPAELKRIIGVRLRKPNDIVLHKKRNRWDILELYNLACFSFNHSRRLEAMSKGTLPEGTTLWHGSLEGDCEEMGYGWMKESPVRRQLEKMLRVRKRREQLALKTARLEEAKEQGLHSQEK